MNTGVVWMLVITTSFSPLKIYYESVLTKAECESKMPKVKAKKVICLPVYVGKKNGL